MTHPFEFTVSAPTRVESIARWTDELRRIEDMGFHALVMADHFTDGYGLEPMVALTAAPERRRRSGSRRVCRATTTATPC